MEDKNSCSEYSAPLHFNTESLIDSFGGLEVAVERCPLCCESKRPYHCKRCVETGKFTLSTATYPVRTFDIGSYEELHRKWDHTKKERDHILERFKRESEFLQRRDIKRSMIEECKRKIELLRKSIGAKKELIEKEKANREKTRRRNLEYHYKSKKHRQKRAHITDYIQKVKDSIEKKRDKLTERQNDLMDVRKTLISDLSTYIFDVAEVKSKGSSLTSMGHSDEVQKQLQEASQTAYVGGRWIYTSNQFRIIAPTLPALGDYSQYNILVARRREEGSSETTSASVPADNMVTTINAGLCYTAQLLSVLSNILNISLPKRQCYSDFCVSEMPEKVFNKAVARLNMNILYLCFSQGVDPDTIEPRHTLHNIMLLLNDPHVGRVGAFDVIQDMMDSVNDSNGNSEESDEEYYGVQSNDELDAKEWETVPENLPEATGPQESTSMQSYGYTSQNLSESQLTASGVLSSAMNSFSYFFRR